MKKALPYILYSIVIHGATGLLIYQGLVQKDLESGDLVKGILVIAAAIIGMVRPRRSGTVSNKKAAYGKAYAEYIQNAFQDEPKLEKKFYNAIHDYNRNRPAAAIAKLEKLRPDCHKSSELRAVTVFMALCLDDMGLYEQAIRHYDTALRIRPNSSLYSNKGLCHQRIGQPEQAKLCYESAISLDAGNAFAHNNLATHYFRLGDYAQALRCAKDAISANARMPQALGCAAVCCAMLGDEDGYRNYYRQAVSAGYDGSKIKETVRALSADL
jgi:tetratricopeptide (TPR) repeat protein